MTVGAENTVNGPLSGLRILEVPCGRVARIAGMVLADLGADVVSLVGATVPEHPARPEDVCWGRGKRQISATDEDIRRLATGADAVLIDATPADLDARALSSEDLRAAAPGTMHVWLPPYGEEGEWRDLPEDPLLLTALGTFAVHLPADDTSPVAHVVPILTQLHGALGAAATLAGLVGRARLGIVQPVVVTGLHASAALMGTGFAELNGEPGFAPTRAITPAPNWRTYECADGKRIFLAALTPDLFFRALDALDRLDVMALPEVDGDFQSIQDLKRGRRAVTAVLEPEFRARTSAEWMTRLSQRRVPCAIVQSRADWMAGPVVADNDARIVREHPELGAVTMPNVPIAFSETPAQVRGFASTVAASDVWTPRAVPSAAASRPPALPLKGLRVVDMTSFFAGPLSATLLADFGADVVRVESPTGDTYRNFQLAFLAVNQRKRGIALNLRDPATADTLGAILDASDVLIENLRPGARSLLRLDDASRTRLVHCSVSAYGQSPRLADLPGFDPILQVLSGMAVAQGGDGPPITSSAGVNDAATGALAAVGVLAALYRRESTDRGQRAWVSLATASTFLQSAEFTEWDGSPEPQRGGELFRGPADGHRYYECGDGWVAVAALDDQQRTAMLATLEATDFTAAAGALRVMAVSQATGRLNGHGVPACRVVGRPLPFRDPFLVANGFSHPVAIPQGTAQVVDHHSRWPAAPEPRPSSYFEIGEHTEEILSSLAVERR